MSETRVSELETRKVSGRAAVPLVLLSLVLLYPTCRWYRTFKAAHPRSILKYV